VSPHGECIIDEKKRKQTNEERKQEKEKTQPH
jgi:hypothetical protein